MTPNYHIIIAKYRGPSNSQGSRIVLVSERFNERKTIPYDHSMNNVWEMAEAWLRRYGFKVVGHGELKDGYAIITDTFMGLKGIRPSKQSINGPRKRAARKTRTVKRRKGPKKLSKAAFLRRMALGRARAARKRRY